MNEGLRYLDRLRTCFGPHGISTRSHFRHLWLFIAATSSYLFTVTAQAEGGFHQPSKRLLIKPFIEAPGQSLEFTNIIDKSAKVRWQPNYRAKTGLSVSYAGLGGFSISGMSELARESAELKGVSRITDYRFRFPWRRFMLSLGYQKNQGFYVDNTASIDQSLAGQYIKNPDMEMESKSLMAIFVADPDYSLAAFLDHSERQTRSGGSWLLVAKFSEASFRDSPRSIGLIPSAIRPRFQPEALVHEGQFRSIGIGGGYGYMLGFGDIGYASAMGLLGPSAQSGKLSDSSQDFTSSSTGALLNVDLGIGANGEENVFGVHLSAEASIYKTAATEAATTLTSLSVFYGRRL
jgi:hypothetical protein